MNNIMNKGNHELMNETLTFKRIELPTADWAQMKALEKLVL